MSFVVVVQVVNDNIKSETNNNKLHANLVEPSFYSDGRTPVSCFFLFVIMVMINNMNSLVHTID